MLRLLILFSLFVLYPLESFGQYSLEYSCDKLFKEIYIPSNQGGGNLKKLLENITKKNLLNSQRVRAYQLEKGDHIAILRGRAYSHHGIFIGGGNVIHYNKNNKVISVQIATLTVFIGKSDEKKDLFRISHLPMKYNRDVLVARARSRLGEKQYHVVDQNCENFATWVHEGKDFKNEPFSFDGIRIHWWNGGNLYGGSLIYDTIFYPRYCDVNQNFSKTFSISSGIIYWIDRHGALYRKPMQERLFLNGPNILIHGNFKANYAEHFTVYKNNVYFINGKNLYMVSIQAGTSGNVTLGNSCRMVSGVLQTPCVIVNSGFYTTNYRFFDDKMYWVLDNILYVANLLKNGRRLGQPIQIRTNFPAKYFSVANNHIYWSEKDNLYAASLGQDAISFQEPPIEVNLKGWGENFYVHEP